tara:strand:- start:326 stop:505 length:180 start_codon:yes stop_codon:yes gene_type:complete
MANKHDDECYANWAKENKVQGWERIYSLYHPAEKSKRRTYAIKQHLNKQKQNFNKEKHR